jgi:hypothetical protein
LAKHLSPQFLSESIRKIKKIPLCYHDASSGMIPLSVCVLYSLEIGVNVSVLLLACTHLIVVPENSTVEVMEMTQVSSVMADIYSVDAIISEDIKSLEQLSKHAPAVVSWLKRNLPIAHTDEHLKKKINALLGAPRFTPNLAHFGLWEDLIQDCKRQALEIGQDMKAYYHTKNLSIVLGESVLPQTFGRLRPHTSMSGVNVYTVEASSVEDCIRRQDDPMRAPNSAVGVIFSQNENHSQFWNEKVWIHALRMIAMAIDGLYQDTVDKICTACDGIFSAAKIKGFVRMKNKCISKEDHYYGAYPRLGRGVAMLFFNHMLAHFFLRFMIIDPYRPSLNIDINRNACTFNTPKDLLAFIDAMKIHPLFGGHPGTVPGILDEKRSLNSLTFVICVFSFLPPMKVRIKNMMLFDEAQAIRQFHYRTVMMNWLYTPNITYQELAEMSKDLWTKYLDFEAVPGFGSKDPSESWETW